MLRAGEYGGAVNPIIENQPARSGQLSAPERDEFELIVAKARSSGWIDTGQCLTAERAARVIVVRSRRAEFEREQRYSDDARWMYELLHDLAHGLWRH